MITKNKELNEIKQEDTSIEFEDIKTIDEAVVCLSIKSKDSKQLSIDEIHIALKTQGKNGYKDAYFNNVYTIVQSLDEAYLLLRPLLIFNKNSDELIKKAEALVSKIKKLNMIKREDVEITEMSVFVAFYLLKNTILSDLKPPYGFGMEV